MMASLLKNWVKWALGRDVLPDMSKTQWFSKEQIRKFQEERLRKIIRHAYENVPYYRQLFRDYSIDFRDIQKIEDLKRIPKLSRKIVIGNYSSLIDPKHVFRSKLSSFTSGAQIQWSYSTTWDQLFGLALFRGFSWAGLEKEKRVVSLHSRMIGEAFPRSLIYRNALDLNTIEKELEEIAQFKPHFAYCYASSAYLVAKYLLGKNKTMPLEGVIVTSDQLLPDYIPVIEEAFQCKVFNNYGCNDGGAWGAQCKERHGFHHDFERSMIEFEENGQMVVTDLWNYAMPFIRYENGDRGEWMNHCCPCGREMPLFHVNGRMDDFIVAPTKIYSPTAIAVMLRHPCFKDVRVVQLSRTDMEVLFVRDADFSKEHCDAILKEFALDFQGMRIEFKEVDEIARSPSDKRRVCMNLSGVTF
jgi:phenylacetate-CoA ligase